MSSFPEFDRFSRFVDAVDEAAKDDGQLGATQAQRLASALRAGGIQAIDRAEFQRLMAMYQDATVEVMALLKGVTDLGESYGGRTIADAMSRAPEHDPARMTTAYDLAKFEEDYAEAARLLGRVRAEKLNLALEQRPAEYRASVMVAALRNGMLGGRPRG